MSIEVEAREKLLKKEKNKEKKLTKKNKEKNNEKNLITSGANQSFSF